MDFFEIEGLHYVIQYPNNFDASKKHPTLFFFHGAGTRGITTEQLASSKDFDTMLRSAGEELVILSPHCTLNSWYDKFETLIRFAHHVRALPYTDPDRLYLMGISMGGYASWQLAISQPELFAAMIPICGGGMYWSASRLKEVPIWAFHGGKDTTVLPEESVHMVEKVNKRGGNAKLTIYPENEHNAWTDTFENPEVFAWLLSHRKASAAVTADDCHGREQFG